MDTKKSIHSEIEQIPESLLPEVLNYIQYLKYKHKNEEKREPALLSEAILAQDWLTPEEDEAWKHL